MEIPGLDSSEMKESMIEWGTLAEVAPAGRIRLIQDDNDQNWMEVAELDSVVPTGWYLLVEVDDE